jgi:hypothetical protein
MSSGGDRLAGFVSYLTGVASNSLHEGFQGEATKAVKN